MGKNKLEEIRNMETEKLFENIKYLVKIINYHRRDLILYKEEIGKRLEHILFEDQVFK